MRKVRIRLTPESVNEAITQINEYRDHIVNAAKLLGEALVADGVAIAKMKILEYDAVETSALLGSIEGFFDPFTGKGIIKAGTNHAAYVEYGTGIVGATNSSHEPKPSGWQHDVNNHGDWGWIYSYGRWTKGMPPRPFMWDTWMELCNSTNEKVRTYFNG